MIDKPFWWILDAERRPRPAADVMEFERWFTQNLESRRVAATVVYPDGRTEETMPGDDRRDLVWVSTVFLGMDPGLLSTDPPRLFETMIFGLESTDDIILRSDSWENAEDTHRQAVEWCQAVRRMKE